MCNKTEGDYQREQRERIVELEADREMLHRLISKMRQSENQTIEEVIEGVGELHPELTEARNAILTEGMARDTAEAQLRAVRRGWDLYDQAMKLPPEDMKRHGPMCDEATDIIDAALSDAPDSQDGGREMVIDGRTDPVTVTPVEPEPVLPGSTLHGRKVLAVVDMWVHGEYPSDQEDWKCGKPKHNDVTGTHIPVTAIITERGETEGE